MRLRTLIFLALSFSIWAAPLRAPITAVAGNSSIEDAQFDLGMKLYRLGRYAEAITELKRLIGEDKSIKYAEVCRFTIGSAFFALGDYGAAKEFFEPFAERRRDGPYGPPSLYYLARIEFLTGRFKESARIFDTYAKEYPELGYADNSIYWMGEAFLRLGEKEKAKECFQELLRKYPQGDKADGAMFNLRLIAMEEELERCRRAAAAVYKTDEPKPAAPQADTNPLLEQNAEEIIRLREKERVYTEEIARLNSRIEALKGEMENLEAAGGADEKQTGKQNRDKRRALSSWENLLAVKERALEQKEKALNEAFEKLPKGAAEAD
jgi:TolA-binding protein